MLKKQLISIVLLCMCFVSTAAYAQQADLYIEDAIGAPGSEATLSVKIDNTEGGVAGFSCKIYLPDGFEVIRASRGSRLMAQNAGGEYLTTFQSAPQTDGSYMLLAYGGQAISGTEGEVAKVTVSIPADAEMRNYEVLLREVECSVGSAVTSTYSETNSVLTVSEKTYAEGYRLKVLPVLVNAGENYEVTVQMDCATEDITDFSFDIEVPSFMTRTKSGRSYKAPVFCNEDRIGDSDHKIEVASNGNVHTITVSATVNDEFKYIAGTSGNLMTLYFSAAATIDADGAYEMPISNVTFSQDGTDLEVAPFPAYVIANCYERETATEWGTICLPYATRSNEYVQLYTLATVDSEKTEMTFSPIENLTANTPAVFKRLGDKAIFPVVTISEAKDFTCQKATDVRGWNMVATYADIKQNSNASEVYYIAENKFWYANMEFAVAAFRGWFETAKASAIASHYTIVETEGEATEVEYLEQKDGSVKIIFDLQGRRLSDVQKGDINIVNGKNVIVK